MAQDLRTRATLRQDERAEALLPAAGTPGEGWKKVPLSEVGEDATARTGVETNRQALNTERDQRTQGDAALDSRVTALENAPPPSAGTDTTARRGVAENAEAIAALTPRALAAREINSYLTSEDPAPFRVFTSSTHEQGLRHVSDLDGDYLLVIRDVDAVLDAAHRASADSLRIFVADVDGVGFQVHDDSAFRYAAGSLVVPFTVDESEETARAVQEALASTPGIVRWQIGFYGANVGIGDFLHSPMVVNRNLVPPADAGTDDTARRAAADAQRTANENRDEITAEATTRRDADAELQARTHDLSVLREQPNWVTADAADGGLALIAQGSADATRVGQGRAPTGSTFAPQVSPPSNGTYLVVARLTLAEAHNLTKYRFGQVISGHTQFVLMGNYRAYASDDSWAYYGVHGAQALTTTDRFTLQHSGDAHFNSYHGDIAQRTANETVAKALVDANGDPLSTDSEGRVQLPALPSGDSMSPYSGIELAPDGLADSSFPDNFYVRLAGRQTGRTINAITLSVGGRTYQPHSSTPVSTIATANRGLIRFDISANRQEISDNAQGDAEVLVRVSFGFTAGDDYHFDIDFPVNNPGFAVPEPEPDPITQALTSAAAIAWDVDDGHVASLTAGHNFTLTLSGGMNGTFAVLRVLQDATGSRTMTFGAGIVLDGRTAPVLSTAAGAHDNILFMRRGTSWVYLGAILNG